MVLRTPGIRLRGAMWVRWRGGWVSARVWLDYSKAARARGKRPRNPVAARFLNRAHAPQRQRQLLAFDVGPGVNGALTARFSKKLLELNRSLFF